MINATLILLCVCFPATDEIDNPMYKQWSKFKAGTSVTMTMTMESAGQKIETITVTTLKSVDAKELVTSTKSTTVVAGQKMEAPAQDQTIPAKLPKPEPVKEDTETKKPKVEEGTEDVTVAGKKFSCKWTKVTNEEGGTKSVVKTWMCDDVPGSFVKMEMSSTGEAASTMTNVVTALDLK